MYRGKFDFLFIYWGGWKIAGLQGFQMDQWLLLGLLVTLLPLGVIIELNMLYTIKLAN